VPRVARNRLLTAAGLAPAYAARRRGSDDLAPLRDAVDWMLARHASYPAFALDRHRPLTSMNPPAAMLFGATGLRCGDGLLTALAENAQLRAALDNLDAVIAAVVARLRLEISQLGGGPVREAGLARLARAHPPPPARDDDVLPAFVPTRYRVGERTLSLVSTLAQFGAVDDLALADWRIELMFPADTASRELLLSLTARSGDAA
jgi:hypothetical protein